ncbi:MULTISPECIES: DUF6882 domain-containing protein [unclassified Brevibacterium]|uniref:DUF6882 domain-containing protein n=1 Tax=unclassified Brevibacterium TaxID=2614124 RepID=UPI0010925F3C|nr:DUF6882 domain-containing protein [Brevibacterium sp. S22]TGD28702.1 hypothetical protein EB835_17210 [Brevibacterium sp. S22]
MSSTLQDLVNRAVFYSTEVQTHFGALIADAEWEVDFSSDPHLTFTSADDVVLRARPHLLGSESDREKTWLWGWENVNEFPDAVVGLSHEVRRFGAAEDVSELTTPELSLDEELALRLTLAAKEATDKWAHYPAGAGAGTTVWLLVDAAEIALPAPQVKVSVRALMQGLTQTTVTDHRAAIESYVAKRGIPTAELPEGGLRMLFSDGSADLSFDDQRRISNCDLNEPLEGEAAEQFAAASSGTPAEAASAPGETTAGDPTAKTAAAATSEPSVTETQPAPTEAPSPTGAGAQTGDSAQTRAGAATGADSSRTGTEAASTTADETVGEETAPASAQATSTGDVSENIDAPAAEKPEPVADEEAPAASRPVSGTADQQEPADGSAKEDKPKKKRLFSKLFGR